MNDKFFLKLLVALGVGGAAYYMFLQSQRTNQALITANAARTAAQKAEVSRPPISSAIAIRPTSGFASAAGIAQNLNSIFCTFATGDAKRRCEGTL